MLRYFLFALSFSSTSAAAQIECAAGFAKSARAQVFRLAQKAQLPANDEALDGIVGFSTSSVRKSLEESDRVVPEPTLGFSNFYEEYGPFGYWGPAGPFGPGNKFGPIGSNPWNATGVVSGTNWQGFSSLLTREGGPESAEGADGAIGPSSAWAYHNVLTQLTPYGNQLKEGGMAMIWGPKGIFGPDGSIGIGSTVGAHGLKRDSATGAFLNRSGKIQTELKVNGKMHELMEHYEPEYAQRLSREGKLDSSFTVDASASAGSAVEYKVNVKPNHWVSFLASPMAPGDRFNLEVLDTSGHVLFRSDEKKLLNSVAARFPKEAQVVVRVRNVGPSFYGQMLSPLQPELAMSNQFRLHVVSTEADPAARDFDGSYLTYFSALRQSVSH